MCHHRRALRTFPRPDPAISGLKAITFGVARVGSGHPALGFGRPIAEQGGLRDITLAATGIHITCRVTGVAD